MVLSNKKQKQKRRATKAELLAASEAQNHSIASDSGNPDSNSLSQHSVKSLLDTSSQKPRLSKREKRRERALEETVGRNQDGYAKRENKEDVSSEKKDENEKKKKKKRKRDDGLESGVSQSVEVKKATKSKKKKNKVKNKKAKKVADVKVKNVVESTSGGSGENVVREPSSLSDSHNNVHDTRKVYVGGIPYYSTEDDIRSYFENCGSTTEVDCMKFPESGKFRGIAIISFKTEAAAKRALTLDGADMGGLFLKIQPYKSTRANKVPEFSPAIVEGYNRIYAGNLPWDITEEELRKLFSDCNINSVRFGEDKETGEFRGYAHVDFADSLSLNMALKLDQKIVCGRPVKISCAVQKKGADTKSKSIQTNKQVDNPGTNSVSGKIRRRTCYECGEKGHLGSSCPKKQVADLVTSKSVQTNMQVDDPGTNSVSGKIRRRTCYECGEKGHLGSSCPKKQGADLVTADNTGMNSADVVTADNSGMNSADLVMTGNSGMNPISGKIRRRTCYECGEKGHLASSCTKKQAANLVTSGAT